MIKTELSFFDLPTWDRYKMIIEHYNLLGYPIEQERIGACRVWLTGDSSEAVLWAKRKCPACLHSKDVVKELCPILEILKLPL